MALLGQVSLFELWQFLIAKNLIYKESIMAFNRTNTTSRNIVAEILKSAKSDFLYLFGGERLSRDEVIQIIEGLNQMGKSLKAFVNRPRDLGQVPSNLFYLDTTEDLELAEQFGKDNNAHIINLMIVHNPKR
ncbi:hypothetical protein [Campylobacter fetus]|uniref:hypothetical protein n=1 Tax=Campylobacter fetus TaxID=196 RepID=UPI00168CD7DF|nr:hypothetical protein [Campylobacter fetus]